MWPSSRTSARPERSFSKPAVGAPTLTEHEDHEGLETVRENVIIAYRGASYELGQWPQGYGIWSAGTDQSQPNEWWPPTPEGWSAAWYRFVAIEVPGTIVQVSQHVTIPAGQPAASTPQEVQPFVVPSGQPYPGASGQPYGPAQPYGHAHPYGASQPYGAGYPYGSAGQPAVSRAGSWQSARAGVGLLIAGLVLGIIGLFPNYVGGASLASQADNLVPHIIYLAAWAASALLIGLGGTRQRVGALLGLGTSLVTFGLFFADAGTVLANGVHLGGPGLLLSLIGWFACAAGSVVAFGPWPADWPRRLRGREVALALILIVAALGAAITFAPSWDRFTLSTSTGTPQ